MCMTCGALAIQTSDGKAPDTTEAILYISVFAVWIMLLTHYGKKWSNLSQR